MNVKDYLERLIVTGPVEQKMALDVHALTRWWLELARHFAGDATAMPPKAATGGARHRSS